MNFKKNEIIQYYMPNQAAVNWGNNDDPEKTLVLNEYYEISEIEEHTWHTKLILKGIEGKFNSVHFRKTKMKKGELK